MLWIAMERGASLIVAADPPSSGKTTTLSALLRLHAARYGGRTSPAAWARRSRFPRALTRYPTYILINEMSDHIPVYTWDDNARRAFELLAEGYSMATTMHDETVEGVIGQLREDLSIPRGADREADVHHDDVRRRVLGGDRCGRMQDASVRCRRCWG